MAKKPGTNPKGEFAFFNVFYEDDSQRSNRRVPSELLGGLGAFALDDLVAALFEQETQHLTLHDIVFHDQRGGTKWLRLSHLRLPMLACVTYVKEQIPMWFGSILKKCKA